MIGDDRKTKRDMETVTSLGLFNMSMLNAENLSAQNDRGEFSTLNPKRKKGQCLVSHDVMNVVTASRYDITHCNTFRFLLHYSRITPL